jgi:putative ABC transport system permease protein
MLILAHTPSTVPLSALDLTLAGGLVLVAGLLSVALRLKLEKQLALASIRTVVQLLLIGYILTWVFSADRLVVVLGLGLVMISVAAHSAISRSKRNFRGVGWRALLTLAAVSLLTTVTVTGVVIGVKPWYEPQYFVPLLGMILGNSMTGLSLSLDSLLESLHERRDRIEMELAHGATRWEAARDAVAEAVRRGMIPIINAMMVVGVVALPGMMTGQILAGADPLQAVKYQIVVMFMVAGSCALNCISMSLLAYHKLFDKEHRLRLELIERKQ